MIIRSKNNPLTLWNGSIFDDLFNDRQNYSLMKTDIREDEDKYIFNIDLPGYKKDDIKISLEDSYLTIEAKLEDVKEVKENANYLRRERKIADVSRSYYVGDVEEDTIEASYVNGVLNINVFKQKEQVEQTKKYITIK